MRAPAEQQESCSSAGRATRRTRKLPALVGNPASIPNSAVGIVRQADIPAKHHEVWQVRMRALGNVPPISVAWFPPGTTATPGAESDYDIRGDIPISAADPAATVSSWYQRGHAWRQRLPLRPSSYRLPRLLPPIAPISTLADPRSAAACQDSG